MANDLNRKVSESELSARYTAAAYRFAQTSAWRDYFELADEFRALDTYKDSAQMYSKCIKAASAPAYREITNRMSAAEALTAEDYLEAARVMKLIQDYQDAREMMRVYTLKANTLLYNEATALLTNHDATTEELGRGVELLRSIKAFKNSRELIERFEKYYFERMYDEATALMKKGHVFSEFDEAAEMFDKIAVYSDAAELAAVCRKQANKLRPKTTKVKQKPEAAPTAGGDEVTRVTRKEKAAKGDTGTESTTVKSRRRVIDDETHNTVLEVWRTIDKRRMVEFIIWIVALAVDVYASILLPQLQYDFTQKYQNEIRGITTLIAIGVIIMAIRAFVRMLTASMRKKLSAAALRTLKRLAAPLIKAINRLLLSIGIDLSRRNRLGGRDEKTFVFDTEEKVKKGKKRLKNELKWQEQPDNVARVRFIFIDYMIRKIKGGYFMKRCMTPAEIGREVCLEEDERCLFATYNKARYAGPMAVEEISDALVGELKAVNQKRS